MEEAIGIINATFASNATVVEAVSMDNVVEAGSIKKALSLLVTQLGFEDEIEDGDLLLLTPGQLHEVARGQVWISSSLYRYFQRPLSLKPPRRRLVRLAHRCLLRRKVGTTSIEFPQATDVRLL